MMAGPRRTKVLTAGTVGRWAAIFTISRRIVVLRSEKSGQLMPLSRRRNGIIRRPKGA